MSAWRSKYWQAFRRTPEARSLIGMLNERCQYSSQSPVSLTRRQHLPRYSDLLWTALSRIEWQTLSPYHWTNLTPITALTKVNLEICVLPAPNSNLLIWNIGKGKIGKPFQKNFCPCVYSNAGCGYGWLFQDCMMQSQQRYTSTIKTGLRIQNEKYGFLRIQIRFNLAKGNEAFLRQQNRLARKDQLAAIGEAIDRHS